MVMRLFAAAGARDVVIAVAYKRPRLTAVYFNDDKCGTEASESGRYSAMLDFSDVADAVRELDAHAAIVRAGCDVVRVGSSERAPAPHQPESTTTRSRLVDCTEASGLRPSASQRPPSAAAA